MKKKNVPREKRRKYLEDRLLLDKKRRFTEASSGFVLMHIYFINSNKRGRHPL
jgi:hypothetical protein